MRDTQNQLNIEKETLMKNTAIRHFRRHHCFICRFLAAAKAATKPQWHAQDHDSEAQTVQHDNIKRASKNDDRTQLVMPAAARAQADEAYRPLRRIRSADTESGKRPSEHHAFRRPFIMQKML